MPIEGLSIARMPIAGIADWRLRGLPNADWGLPIGDWIASEGWMISD
jgi:hypothetical protein